MHYSKHPWVLGVAVASSGTHQDSPLSVSGLSVPLPAGTPLWSRRVPLAHGFLKGEAQFLEASWDFPGTEGLRTIFITTQRHSIIIFPCVGLHIGVRAAGSETTVGWAPSRQWHQAVLVIVIVFTTHTCQFHLKKTVKINFIKSWPLSTHLFNIPYNEMWGTQKGHASEVRWQPQGRAHVSVVWVVSWTSFFVALPIKGTTGTHILVIQTQGFSRHFLEKETK